MKPWVIPAIALATLAGGFAAGRYTAREPDVREVERIVYKDRAVEIVKVVTVKEAAEVKRVVVYRERTIQPDGTRVEREVERTDSAARTVENGTSDIIREKSTEGGKVRERSELSPRPDWRAGVLVGGSFRLDPLSLTPVYGVHVERRILGPFSVGAWGLHTGTAGLSLSLEF